MARKTTKKKSSKGKKSGLMLRFYSNRRTPVVARPGAKGKYKKSYGKHVKSRRATKAEMKKMRGGKWLRVDSKGRTPGKKGYLGGKSMGPSKAASRKAVAKRKRK